LGGLKRPERPKFEAKRESGKGFLGSGQRAPSPPARGPGECCKLPQQGSGGALTANTFWTF